MRQCIQCGRELSSLSVGDDTDVCPECTHKAKVERSRASDWLLIPKMFPISSAVLVIDVLVFLVAAIATWKSGHGSIAEFDPRLLLRLGADYGPLTLDREWWRVLTCMFLHGGIIHVAANMYCFWIFGRIAERIYGAGRFASLYLITGIASSLSSLAIHPNSVSVGASGAIFGLFGAAFIIARGRGLNTVASELGFLLLINLALTFGIRGISIGGHLGGLAGGLLCALVIVAGERGMFGPRRLAMELLAMAAIGFFSIASAIAVA